MKRFIIIMLIAVAAIGIIAVATAPPDPLVLVEPASEPTAPPVDPPTPTPPPAPSMTRSQENAVGSAESYLEFMSFSRQGLIDQLTSEYGEGFPLADATFAVDYLDVDWFEQAAGSAEEYLEVMSFSCQGLIDQLSSEYGEAFTADQAVYGATQAGLCGSSPSLDSQKESARLVDQKAEFVEWLLIGEEPFLAEVMDEYTPEYVGRVIDGVCIEAMWADNAADFVDSLTDYFSYDELEDGGYSLVTAALLTGCEEEAGRLLG